MKFIFRDLVVFEYDTETKQVNAPNEHVEWGVKYNDGPANFNMCNFTPEDYQLLAKYFNAIHMHTQGIDVELKDIEVY